jgi:phosphatidyl-myo-inositol dimannoside synthase
LNVTIICDGFDRSSIRLQPWRRLYELSKRMLPKDNSVTIITDGHSEKQEYIENIRIVRISKLMLAPFLNVKNLISVILKTNPDVVVWYGSPFSAIYLTRFKLLGKPLIWDIDTDLYDLRFLSRIPLKEILNPINQLYTYLIAATYCRLIIATVANSLFVSKIIVPNIYLKSVLCKKGVIAEKLVIIPSTIEAKEIAQTNPNNPKYLRAKLGLKTTEFIITYFGAPHLLRGPDVAIISMRKILKENKNVRLLVFSRRVIGDTSRGQEYFRMEEEYLQKLAKKLKVDNHLDIIPGFLDKTLMQQYLQASDAVVLPFRLVSSEPPLSLFEVMRLGKTVITTNLGGLREIIGKNRGILVEPGNVDKLAEAISFLARNPKMVAVFGRNAQLFANSLPDWDDVAEQFVQVLATAVSEAK